jgi:hypothetical protein
MSFLGPFDWTHLIGSAAVILTVYGMLAGERRRRELQHVENQRKLTAIETMLHPIWAWWNSGGGGSSGGDDYRR